MKTITVILVAPFFILAFLLTKAFAAALIQLWPEQARQLGRIL